MKNKIALLVVFCLLLLAQLAVPAAMALRSERLARDVEAVFNFKYQAYNPRDIFRGNYLWGNFDTGTFCLPDNPKNLGFEREPPPGYGRRYLGYFEFQKNAEGLAQIKAVHASPPSSGAFLKMYFTTFDRKQKEEELKNVVSPTWPFGKFFISEKDAPVFQKIFDRARARDSKAPFPYLAVAISGGQYAVLDIFIDGIPSKEIKKHAGALETPAQPPATP